MEDLEQAGVVVDDVSLGVELQEPIRHRLDEATQELPLLLQRLLGGHLGRDVDELDEHVVAVGLAEVVVKRLSTHIQLPSLRLRRRRICWIRRVESIAIHPSTRARLVVGMDLVEHRLADHLFGAVAEHLRERLVAIQDNAALSSS